MNGRRRAMRVVGMLLACMVAMTALPSWAAGLEDTWRYRGEITNRGTRSEGFSGALAFDGQEVPARIGQIQTPIGEFKFVAPGMLWQPSGWLRTSGLAAPAKSEQPFDAAKDVIAHWYKGGLRPGTPGGWIYLPGLQVWINPFFLKQYAETELKDAPDPLGPLASLMEEMKAKQQTGEERSAVFVYETGVAGKMTKSAGERGLLSYNGHPIQSPVVTLKTPIGSFNRAVGTLPWEPQGWFSADEVKVEDTAVPFSQADQAKGSYEGPRRAGTPTEWCYSPFTKTWYAPERLQ